MTASLPTEDSAFLDRIIDAYLAHRPLFYAFIRPQEALLFHQHQKLIQPPILDFGCGDGFFAYQVFGPNVLDVGLDVDSSRIQESGQWPVYRQTLIYDGDTIPFPDNYFQTVISNCVFEHLPHLSQKLTEIHRVLKPGGHLLTTVMTDQWEEHLLGTKILGTFYQRWFRHRQDHLNLYSLASWTKLFTASKFKCQDVAGYQHLQSAHWNEICHFLSIPSLLSYRLLGRWVLFPHWYQPFHLIPRLRQLVTHDLSQTPTNPGAIFFTCQKTKND